MKKLTSQKLIRNNTHYYRTFVTWAYIFMLGVGLASLPRVASGQELQPGKPLPNAHSHNDYLRARPLEDAIENGFCSVEADIFLVDGELLVGHFRWALNKERTLEEMYLKPLKKLVAANDGSVYPNGPTFNLLIDIKQHGNDVYPVLKTLLKKHQSMLSGLEHGKFVERPIRIVISGSCPRDLIKQDKNRLVAIDGRLSDLDSSEPWHLIPLISAKWGSNFEWRGKSELSKTERKRLEQITNQAHDSKRQVRFWATPESPTVWKHLLESKVDLINTDDLPKLRKFLVDNASEN